MIHKIGFYKFDNDGTYTITLGANKAYLETPASGGSVKGFVLNLGDLDGIQRNEEVSKNIESIYNLAGQKMNRNMFNGKLPKGIYIINGKKVTVQ